MRAFRKKQLFILKAAIKGLAEESKVIRKTKIQTSKDIERQIAYENKNLLSAHTRACLLAYALLQGKKYEEVENNVPLQKPESWSTREIIYSKIYDICSQFGGSQFTWSGEKEFTKGKFLGWINGEPNTIFVRRKRIVRKFKSKVSKVSFGGFDEKK